MLKSMSCVFILILSMSVHLFAFGLGLGPQVGFQKANDAEEAKFMGGVALRAKLTPSLGVEGSINYRQEKYANGNVTVKSWPVLVTGLFYPLPIIYGAVGAGWYNTTMDYNDEFSPIAKDETTQEFGWHFGGGVELPFGSSTKVTGDIRYVFLNYDFKQVPGTNDLNSDFYMVTFGILYGF